MVPDNREALSGCFTNIPPPVTVFIGPAIQRFATFPLPRVGPVIRLLGATVASVVFHAQISGQPVTIESAPEGVVEAGVPDFFVNTPASIGLRSAPTDIHELPDGRILLVSDRQLAFGDGTRWKVLDQAIDDVSAPMTNVAVDGEGRIYAGTPGGISMVTFNEDATWSLAAVASLDAADFSGLDATPSRVSMSAGRWFWHSGSGPIYEWNPGAEPRVAGSSGAIDEVFEFDGSLFMTDRSDGNLFRMVDGTFELVDGPSILSPNYAVTCAARSADGGLIVGTQNVGIRRFDGKSHVAMVSDGLLAGGRRINDLKAVPEGYFAAAVDNLGVVFFVGDGRVQQVLDRTLDNRLARPRRLLVTTGGVVWALLNDGVACVEFPTRISHMEPLVPSGLFTAFPARHDGHLWLLADGRVHRGIYSDDERLVRFDPDSPEDEFVFTFTTSWGKPLASTARGMFEKTGDGWRLVVPGVVNARLLKWEPEGRRWLFVGNGEMGWLNLHDDWIEVERLAVPEFGNVYGFRFDRNGDIWLELGVGSVARISFGNDAPVMDVFGAEQGIPSVWAQIVVIDGDIRFSVAERMWLFDADAGRFVIDEEFHASFPEMLAIYGRPNTDSRGRLWVSANGSIFVIDERADRAPVIERLDGLSALYFTFEESGVVWMYDQRRLTRYDPSIPVPPEQALHAVITEVRLPSTERTLYSRGGDLGVLDFEDNSLIVSFMAPGNPFAEAVHFEYMLEGAGKFWVPAGINGVAAFNQLSEGSYVFRVRPRAGGLVGEEVALAFVIRPPWYRTPIAFFVYAALIISLVFFAVWVSSFLQRREKMRLEHLVEIRTNELRDTNERLECQASELRGSEERYRKLSLDLERRVEERTSELHGANELLTASNRELEAFSYSVSHDLRAPLRNIRGFADLLHRRNAKGLDPEARRFLDIVASEASRLAELIDSLLGFSRLNRTDLNRTDVDLKSLIDVVRNEFGSEIAGRKIEWRIGELPIVRGDLTLLRQVVSNLVANALKFTRERERAVIEFGVARRRDGNEVVFFVRDNGVGFDQAYSGKLFGVFQRLHSDARYEGTGIGLANVHRIITRHGGRVWAEGVPGEGATFFFTLGAGAITRGA